MGGKQREDGCNKVNSIRQYESGERHPPPRRLAAGWPARDVCFLALSLLGRRKMADSRWTLGEVDGACAHEARAANTRRGRKASLDLRIAARFVRNGSPRTPRGFAFGCSMRENKSTETAERAVYNDAKPIE